jgi:hypothetical protein
MLNYDKFNINKCIFNLKIINLIYKFYNKKIAKFASLFSYDIINRL